MHFQQTLILLACFVYGISASHAYHRPAGHGTRIPHKVVGVRHDSDAEMHAQQGVLAPIKGAFDSVTHRIASGYASVRAGASMSTPKQSSESASAPCIPKTGLVHVKSVDGDNECGYLSGKAIQFDLKGQFTCTSRKDDALVVLASCDAPTFDLVALNLKTPYPFVGGVVGVASTDKSLGPSSANYAYVSGVQHTVFGASAQDTGSAFTDATNVTSTVESSIWTMNDQSQLIPHWTNEDGSTPATSIAWLTNLNELYLTGDYALLSGLYPPSVEKWDEVTFTLVPL